MRLARHVLAGLVAGALLGFLVELVRPRPRGMLPGVTTPTQPSTRPPTALVTEPPTEDGNSVDVGEGSGR